MPRRDPEKLLTKKLQYFYQAADDPGLHAAIEWLLRQWQHEKWLDHVNEEWARDVTRRGKTLEGIRQALATPKARRPQWYVNSQGQTMVVVPGPVKFQMGSPPLEADRYPYEDLHRVRIGRTFALAAKPVTWQQYFQFAPEHTRQREEQRSPSWNCPVNFVSWYQAAKYCNWLSKAEGLPECYETDAAGEITKLKDRYLSLPGYRLPTEAEMEFATRAGARTSRYFGETEELLPKYAWYVKNSNEKTWPVGSLKPNDLGLFDAHGNVFTWCQERFKDYAMPKNDETTEDKEDDLDTGPGERALRGGSFLFHATIMRSALRHKYLPAAQNVAVGFRPARTFLP